MFGVLLLHSFGSTNLEMEEFAEYLQEQGFRTTTPLLPGHGSSPEELANYTFKDWISAGVEALDDLNCTVSFIVGQSTSAPLALHIASSHPELLGIITLSGLISLTNWQILMKPILHLHRFNPLTPEVTELAVSNPKIWERIEGYRKVPKKSLLELYALIKQARKRIKKIHQPIYIFHSSSAKEVSKRNAHIIFDGVSSKKKKLMFIDKGGSLMSVDRGRHIIFREASAFFWNRIDLWQM